MSRKKIPLVDDSVRGLIGETEMLRVVIAEMENESLRLQQELRSAREEIALRRIRAGESPS